MRYTEEDLRKIIENVSVLDYFQHLAKQGKVNFERKSGRDYYFRTDENKFSVNETGFYDFKTGEGGKLIKAVMTLENKSWKEAMDFLKDFSNTYIPEDIAEIKRIKENRVNETNSAPSITQITPPNNDKLIAYFNERGISKEVLEAYTKQVHYQVSGKKYFGIGLENQSKGYEIRNPMMKTKLGKNDLTIVNKDKGKNVFVFEGMTDMLSFLQLQKLNNQENKSTLVVLNSVVNVDKFAEEFKDYKGKISLLLDGDKAGTEATNKIITSMPQHHIQDLRWRYGIGQNNINDLNDYLKNRQLPQDIVLQKGMKVRSKATEDEYYIHSVDDKSIGLRKDYFPFLSKVNHFQVPSFRDFFNHYDVYDLDEKKIEISEKSRIFTQENNTKKLVENERNIEQSAGISNPQSVERGETISNDRNLDQTSQSQHGNTNREPKTLDSHNAGNGLGSSEFQRLGERGLQPTGSSGNSQPPSDGVETTLQGEEFGGVRQNLAERNGNPSNQENGLGDVNAVGEPSVLELVQNLKEQKPTNEQIAELVNALTEVSEDKTIHLNPNIEITDDIKNLVSQYKSGGIAKEGRGILDEYYTDERLVQAVGNLIKDHFKGQKEIKVLEPSVGTGNFLSALNNLNSKTDITTFEINETTAKISKILNPNTNVNLRSFETEFITDNGQKKDFAPKYDLVIGNPPYGQHRGLYKGLGEEPKIARYEDYFIKRSLDLMNEGGTLAMVVPSGWLNRQNNLKNAELTEAYRLPNGVFKATDVGTDIIILKKNSNAEIKDISNYFEQNPNRVLGEIGQKTNRFGKLEDYVKGDLDSALSLIEQLRTKQETQKNQQAIQLNLFDIVEPIAEEKISEQQPKEIDENLPQELQKNIEDTLNRLHNIKFKSPVIINEIEKYNGIYREIENTPQNFDKERIKDISDKLERLNKKIKTNEKEYTIQSSPEIKKGILKYQFQKEDEIIATGLQNSPNITDRQVEAFRNTHYDGVMNNPEKYQEFANYYKGDYIHDFYYAEGDIYEKLETLEQDKDDISQEQYAKQKALLEKVLPQKKELEDIIVSPNQEFVHQFVVGEVEKMVQEQTGWNYGGRNPTPIYENKMKVVEETLAEKFKNFLYTLPSEAFGNSSSWEVRAYVDNKQVTGKDKDYNALIRERRKEVGNDLFNKFLREELDNDTKTRFVDEFNRKHNNIHIPNYKEFPLFSNIHKNFKGRPLELTEVQKAGIGRLTTKGVGLLAHEVGFGKTLSGVLSMHEAMERGNAKRPLIVAPNDSILKQWVETIYETIPNAKVNVLGNLGKNIDLSKFDNKDGEISLVTYEGFNNIGFSRAVTQDLANKFSYISENETKTLKYTERDIQKEIQQQEETEGKMRRGKLYDWEDFGFDHLTFDEAHNANHIVGKVRIDDRKYASDFRNQNQATSLLGMNTWVASQYIQEQNDGRNVNLLSATPFTNKPLEYYSILSLIANDRLEKSGYFNVNTFFETFMEADNDMEIDAKGDIKYKTNVRRFKNNALFQQLLGEFIDIKGEEDNPELKRPNRINKEYKIEQNDLTQEAYERLNKSFNESKKGAILTHILNARLIAMSPYLAKDYDGETPTTKEFIENSPKLKTTMDLIAQNKKDQPNAGQIIYSELGVAEFPKLKEYLVDEVGYKSDEVGIITGATSKNQRLDIQEKFNEGKIKIVIGSEAIQEGMNLQKKTSDMYLLSLPYNFTSLRQTEGRAWRQGNQWENVRINFMLTNDSIDVFMLQKLQAKQARYMEAMKKGANIIDVSDVDTSELKTAIITDPSVRADIEIDVMRNRYDSEKTRLKSELVFLSRKFEDYVASKEYQGLKYVKSNLEYYQNQLNEAKEKWEKDVPYWEEKFSEAKEQLPLYEEALKQREKKFIEKGMDIKAFQTKKEQTETKIAELDNKIYNELPVLREKLITQYQEEKEDKLKNYNPVDFVRERAEENKTFFKLSSNEEKEKKMAEKENISTQQTLKQDKPRGFRR